MGLNKYQKGDFANLPIAIYQKSIFNCLNPFKNISGYKNYKQFNDQNKPRVNNKRSFIDNPYLFLAVRFVHNYTHYPAISVTIFF